VEAWEQTLGSSEQQRLGFVRLLLHRPRWIFIQQATDGLDAQGEAEMLALLDQDFLQAAVVIIADHADERYAGWRQLTFVKQDALVVAQLPAL
jgi:putative ATP-binding cassette transporter